MRVNFILICVSLMLPTALAAQKIPAGAVTALSNKTASSNVLKPLSSASIEALVARGKSKQVIQRALGVAAQRNLPEISVLQDGQVHRALLEQIWKQASVLKYRWEEGNMLGMNSWLIVLAHRIREGVKLNQVNLEMLDRELLLAQEDAEREFKKRYQYSSFEKDFSRNPSFLSILGEAVAYRLDSNFLPNISSSDRVRLLKVLMHGVFSGELDWQELHTAVLYREIREGLRVCGRKMKRVELYGQMKEALRQSAREAAREAAENNIVSMVKLRELFIDNLESFSSHFSENEQVWKEWNRLLLFFRNKQK